MSIVGNALSEIGDSIVFKTEIPTIGLTSITGYAEDVVGLTATRFFDRQFRYSLDGGLNWTYYLPLTTVNLALIPVQPHYDVMFEYKYTRVGSDSTGVLLFNNVEIQGTYQSPQCGDIFANSVFSFFFNTCNSSKITGWALNVLRKVYTPGIISLSLVRGAERNQDQQDRDYIDFWRSITTYFAYFVAYAREMERFHVHRTLLLKYLRNRDLYVCNNQSLTDLNYIMRNYYDEMRHRGTFLIAKKKGDILYDNVEKPVDGELLRLICFNSITDEFLFAIQEFNTAGWVVDSWSPLWQGISHQAQLTKIYEPSMDFVDLTKYPLINDSNCSIITDGDKEVLSISNVLDGQMAGIGFDSVPDFEFATNIFSGIAYELSFYIKQVDVNAPFSVRIFGYDAGDNLQIFEEIQSGVDTISNEFIVEQTVVQGEYIFVRVIIFPYDHVYIDEVDVHTPNILIGQNLRFTQSITKIIPQVTLENNTGVNSGEIRLWGFKFCPLSTQYSTGFIEISNLIQTWMVNSGQYNETQINWIMSNKLLPLGVPVINNILS